MNSVVDIINSNSCIKCGGCFGVCPNNAIRKEYNKDIGFFEFNVEHTPHSLQLCSLICPKKSMNYRIDKSYTNNKVSYIGNYKDVFLAFSQNDSVRFNSTSGGVINSVIRYLIEHNIVDEAIVVA